ncbi:alpha/beta fold hydrolase [Streptomyces sp. NPDC056549]|uniref:alpha/beta fold hydrolase n=1 Tax=Streptomyces sp. NPDC056549 TaxID=3345864 RepID=UPI0036B6F048
MPDKSAGPLQASVTTPDGFRLWTARHTGGDTPTLFCHGGPGAWDNLAPVAHLITPAATSWRWDQRGCGRSDRTGPYTLAQTLDDLDTVRAHTGHTTVALLGHSYGAHLVLLYALQHPNRARALVYVSGTGIDAEATWHSHYKSGKQQAIQRHQQWVTLSELPERTPAQERVLAAINSSGDYADPVASLHHAQVEVDTGFTPNKQCNKSINTELRAQDPGQLAAACAQLTIPVLVVDGAHDIRPRWSVDSLITALPNVQRVTLDAGHLPWVEQPDAFAAAVTQFLQPS